MIICLGRDKIEGVSLFVLFTVVHDLDILDVGRAGDALRVLLVFEAEVLLHDVDHTVLDALVGVALQLLQAVDAANLVYHQRLWILHAMCHHFLPCHQDVFQPIQRYLQQPHIRLFQQAHHRLQTAQAHEFLDDVRVLGGGGVGDDLSSFLAYLVDVFIDETIEGGKLVEVDQLLDLVDGASRHIGGGPGGLFAYGILLVTQQQLDEWQCS